MSQLANSRDCPVCAGRPGKMYFPYSTRYAGVQFSYLRCATCKSVFVDPVPSLQTFEQIYAKSAYHDQYYDGRETDEHIESAALLGQYITPQTNVLDYGCGLGSFLKACVQQGLVPVGVELDPSAAQFARQNANCEVMSVGVFAALEETPRFDAIHLGDVLGHLPDPAGALRRLLRFLRPNGVLFIEGPLETNPSVVYWAARFFGLAKRLMRPGRMPSDPPTMLFRADANSQRMFFEYVDRNLKVRHWQVYETGWPYADGGFVKRTIAALALMMGGRRLFSFTFGNRFKTILSKDPS